MSQEELKASIKALEDIEAIKKLKSDYCYYIDTRNLDAWASLFAEDAELDYDVIGTPEAGENIKAYIERSMEPYAFTRHMAHDPKIEVNGDKASGRWYFHGASTFKGAEGTIACAWGRYEEEYVRVGGEWKFKYIRFMLDLVNLMQTVQA